MPGNVIATAWIHVQPEMQGIRGEISGEVGKELDRSESDAKASGKKAGEGFSSGFKAAVGGVAAFLAAAGIGELTQQAAETDMAMSKLSASAEKNGVGAQAMQSAYSGLVGVIGETDRSVETAGNMFALCGDNQAQLQSLTTSLTGAFSQFGDGLPIESLAEAANETARTGLVVGGMADALNWVNASTDQWSAALGGNSAAQAAFNAAVEQGMTKEDAFNAALAACSDEGERQQLVVDTLNALYGEAGAKYQETNADLIAYNQSQDALRQSAAELGTALMPIVSTVAGLASGLMTGLAPAAQTVATFISSGLNQAFALAQPLIGAVSTAAMFLAQNLGTIVPVLAGVVGGLAAFRAALAIQAMMQAVTTALNGMSVAQYASAAAQRVLNAAMKANPIVLVVTLIGSLVAALVTLYTTNEDFRNAVNNAWNTIKSTAENVFGRIKTFFTKDIPNAIKTAQEWFSNLPSNIGNALNRALNSVRAWAGNLGDQAVRAGQSFLNGIRNKFSEMLSYIGGIPGRIRSGLGNLGSTLLSAGSDLIAGLGQGVMNGIQGVVDSVSAGVQRVVDAAKGLLGIASPSRVFMEIGDYSMQGLAIGFERGERPAARAAVGTLESLMAQAASARTPMLSRASAGSAARGDTYQVIIDGDAMDASPQIERAFDAFVSALNTRYDMGVE